MTGAELREQVLGPVLAGAELTDVEKSVIEPAALDEEEKAALWLLAWAAVEECRPTDSRAHRILARTR